MELRYNHIANLEFNVAETKFDTCNMVMMGKMGGLKASTKFKESTNKD